ncbi:hypothetical protein POV27_11480 [Aureisphaera galaxeae]|uniref:hypothetical protein n=1 Tax=Aureisphaera galaxeae TaxID=1538023 RepID=UPI0023509E01|nr:hypothetical protein [Aureisphaera galaxeae]MDC8004673.1 hypothetical protein [Aureisphaera galaxeae]
MRLLKVLILVLISICSSCQTNFNKEVWQEPKNNELLTRPNPRFIMANDVIENYLEIGQTKAEVLEILGVASKDTVKLKIIEGRIVPDSLKMDNILQQKTRDQDRLVSHLNNWYELNREEVKMISYYVGWTLADPVSLEIYFDNDDKIIGFELVQH